MKEVNLYIEMDKTAFQKIERNVGMYWNTLRRKEKQRPGKDTGK